MGVRAGKVLRPSLVCDYTYDFGSSTDLALRVVGTIDVNPAKSGIRLLARNEPPRWDCVQCGKGARQICSECGCSDEAFLCGSCAAKHECGEEMLLPVVNSPRMGVCGYTG